MGIKGLVKQVLTEQENKHYRRQLSDRQMTYAAWLGAQEKVWTQGKVPEGEMPEHSTVCDDGFVLFTMVEGVPTAYARKNIARYFAENPETMVVYGDEDIQDEDGVVRRPWFKPDWSPDFFDSCFYFGNLVAVRRSWWERQQLNLPGELLEPARGMEREKTALKESKKRENTVSATAGNTAGETVECVIRDRNVYEGLVRALVSGGYARSSQLVGHIPQILFHAAGDEAQERFLMERERQPESYRIREKRCMERCGTGENGQPLVSVIIPSKDQPDLLQECMEGIFRCGGGISCEILVVDNGSSRENKVRLESLVRELQIRGERENGRIFVRYLYEPMEFNFSRMCNRGSKEAKGKLLLFLNDDVTLQLPGSIAEMAELAARAYTGAVGMKLLYPNSGRIQHAGITNLPMGPVHKLQFCTDEEVYYGRANHCRRNFLAVTAACLMVDKTRFEEAGGFPEELRVAFNDVALCFRLYELGYFNVCLNDRYALHHESLSRGADETPEKLWRLLDERRRLYEKSPELEGRDPYYSVHLNSCGLDTQIAPAYETAANAPQKETQRLKRISLKACRQDACLLFRVEDSREREITGYGVVLGDNNACYEKTLLLQGGGEKIAGQDAAKEGLAKRDVVKENTASGLVYGVVLDGQYRPDLERNLKGQENVALSGFWLRLTSGAVPAGRYRVGILARNRVSGLKLFNWSNRYVEL